MPLSRAAGIVSTIVRRQTWRSWGILESPRRQVQESSNMAAAAIELMFWTTCPATKVEAMPEEQSDRTGAVEDYSTFAAQLQSESAERLLFPLPGVSLI
jgi:hypothetical protein